MIQLRPYQLDLDAKIRGAWASGARNVLATAPTGSGKTVTFCHILADHKGAAVAIAHRQELVSQMSLALAREGVRHSVIAPRSVVKFIVQLHRMETQSCFYDPAAPLAVAGVDTLIKRPEALARWSPQVGLWIMDEGHHLLTGNKWGTAAAMFPNARGLGVTATPCRADGKGLGRHADGVFDALVEGPSMRELIDSDEGYLTDYRIYCPPSDLDLSDVAISGATGDFNKVQLSKEMQKSTLVGGIVKHYLRYAAGLRGITFVHDVETAHRVAKEFMDAGVPAAAVSAKTPERERHYHVQRLRSGELLQLVNVDLFGEGFDLPAVSVVSFARPTQSYPLYVQQFGRGLRPFPGKGYAIILDHVGNVQRHNGPPDIPRPWSLDRRPSRRRGERDPDIIPTRICIECSRPFEACLVECPYCRSTYTPDRRDGPEHVDGDLVELDGAALDAMRGAVARVDEAPAALAKRMGYGGAPPIAIASAAKNQRLRQASQDGLRRLLGLYGSIQQAHGRGPSESQKRFYYRYGLDVLSAQALGRSDADALACKLLGDLGVK